MDRNVRFDAIMGGIVRSWVLAAVSALACAGLLAIVASPASAATSYSSIGSFGTPGSGPGELEGVGTSGVRSHIAVDDSTGQVFVVDNGTVKVYDGSGGLPTFLTQFGGTELVEPRGIAIDQASHAIYVGDSGNGRIVRYMSDGQPTPTFTQDLTYVSPGASEILDFTSPLAIDPNNGDLLVADRGSHKVLRFDSNGQPVGTPFDGSDSQFGTFDDLESIAADASGDIYVVDVHGNGQPIEQPAATSVVERFSSTGVFEEQLGPMDDSPHSVAFDSKSGNVVVGGRTPKAFGVPLVPLLYVFNEGNLVATFEYPAEVGAASPAALAVDGGASGRLYALVRLFAGGTTGVAAFDPLLLPDIAVAPVTDVATTTATFHGTIDPVGVESEYRFEYSDNGGQSFQSTDPVAVGTTAGPVSQAVTGLEPNLQYLVRIVGINGNGSIRSSTVSFSTLEAPPSVTTIGASDRTTETATLRGTVNPHGLQTTYHFEYGTSTEYGSRVPVSYENVAGNGHQARSLQAGIGGLQPGTLYHFRLVATSSAGTAAGDDVTFTTPSIPPSRAYELVSPADKDGGALDFRAAFAFSPSSDRIAYRWRTVAGGQEGTVGSAPALSWSMAKRDPTSWKSSPLDPPQYADDGQMRNLRAVTTLATSEDGTHALVISRKDLANGAGEGDSNFYLLDIDSGELTTVVSVPGPEVDSYIHGLQASPYVDGTADFSQVLIGGIQFALLPGAPLGAMYEWAGGQFRLVSIDQNGDAVGGVFVGTSTRIALREPRYISDDGHRVLVLAGEASPIYVRIDGEESIVASASQQSGSVGEVRGGRYAGFSRDGKYVLFFGRDLTNDSPANEESLYRFDIDTRQLEFLTAVGASGKWLQTSETGDTVYFFSQLALAPGGVANADNLYVWRNGQVRYAATLDVTREFVGTINEWMGSPNGRYFAFASYSQLTSYDNSSKTACVDFFAVEFDPTSNYPEGTSCREIYRFDAETGELTCASCRPDGGPVTGNAHIGPRVVETGSNHFPHVTTNDGRVFFDTPDPLASKDANFSRDVYEYDGDQVTLISGGFGPGDSQVSDVSPDGSDVFFTTQDRLLPVDQDNSYDLYDARVGGGLASQSPEPGPGACVTDDCRGPVAPPPSTFSVGSGVGNRTGGTPSSIGGIRKLTSSDRSTLAKGGKARLRLKVSGPGTVTVTGTARLGKKDRRVVSASARSGKAGPVSVPFGLSKSGLSELSSRGSLTVSLTIRYEDARPKGIEFTLRSATAKKGGRS